MLLEAKFMKKLLYMMIVIPFLLLLGCGQSEQSSEGTTSEKKVRKSGEISIFQLNKPYCMEKMPPAPRPPPPENPHQILLHNNGFF